MPNDLSELPLPGFETQISDDPPTVLHAERLRDGRIALGTRARRPDGGWDAGELYLLDALAFLDLSAWLSLAVQNAWIETVRDRQPDSIRTARELYGEQADALGRLAREVLREIPPHLLVRALVLMVNSIGPEARRRLVARLNATADFSEDAALRRQIAEESEAFAYGVAAAALFDAIDQGLDADD